MAAKKPITPAMTLEWSSNPAKGIAIGKGGISGWVTANACRPLSLGATESPESAKS